MEAVRLLKEEVIKLMEGYSPSLWERGPVKELKAGLLIFESGVIPMSGDEHKLKPFRDHEPISVTDTEDQTVWDHLF